MMQREPERSTVGTLVAGRNAGYWTLPQPLLDALDMERRVTTERWRIQELLDTSQPETAVSRVADSIMDAIEAGRPTDPKILDEVLRAAESQQRGIYLQQVFGQLGDRTTAAVMAAYHDQSETIVTDHLAVALEAAMDAVREIAPILAGLALPLDGPTAIGISDGQRAAYGVLLAIQVRYQAIRQAHRRLTLIDDADRFGEIENWRGLFVDETGHDWFQGHRQAGWFPDRGLSPLERLLWLAGDGVEPWVPTPSQHRALMQSVAESSRGTLHPSADRLPTLAS